MRLLELERVYVAHLAVDRDVRDTALFDHRSVQEVIWVEPDLIIKQHDVLTGQPLLDVFVGFAVVLALAHFEFDRKLLSLRRVVVTPDD